MLSMWLNPWAPTTQTRPSALRLALRLKCFCTVVKTVVGPSSLQHHPDAPAMLITSMCMVIQLLNVQIMLLYRFLAGTREPAPQPSIGTVFPNKQRKPARRSHNDATTHSTSAVLSAWRANRGRLGPGPGRSSAATPPWTPRRPAFRGPSGGGGLRQGALRPCGPAGKDGGGREKRNGGRESFGREMRGVLVRGGLLALGSMWM